MSPETDLNATYSAVSLSENVHYHIIFFFLLLFSLSLVPISCPKGKYKDLKIEMYENKDWIFFFPKRTEAERLLLDPKITPFHKKSSFGHGKYFIILSCFVQLTVDHHHL